MLCVNVNTHLGQCCTADLGFVFERDRQGGRDRPYREEMVGSALSFSTTLMSFVAHKLRATEPLFFFFLLHWSTAPTPLLTQRRKCILRTQQLPHASKQTERNCRHKYPGAFFCPTWFLLFYFLTFGYEKYIYCIFLLKNGCKILCLTGSFLSNC